MIGDPSGQYRYEKDDDTRDRFSTMLTASRSRWQVSLISQMTRHYLLIMLTGFLNLNYVELLREVGACILSVNRHAES